MLRIQEVFLILQAEYTEILSVLVCFSVALRVFLLSVKSQDCMSQKFIYTVTKLAFCNRHFPTERFQMNFLQKKKL